MITKLLFLDIDGVLTSVVNGTSFHCGDPSSYCPDPECQANLLRIAQEVPELRVVVHSSWVTRGTEEHPCLRVGEEVYESPLNNVCSWLIQYDLFQGLVDPQKYDSNGKRITKAQKIVQWLTEHSEELSPDCRVLVLDDDVSFNDLPSINTITFSNNIVGDLKFLPISHTTGLTEEDAARAVAYFNG